MLAATVFLGAVLAMGAPAEPATPPTSAHPFSIEPAERSGIERFVEPPAWSSARYAGKDSVRVEWSGPPRRLWGDLTTEERALAIPRELFGAAEGGLMFAAGGLMTVLLLGNCWDSDCATKTRAVMVGAAILGSTTGVARAGRSLRDPGTWMGGFLGAAAGAVVALGISGFDDEALSWMPFTIPIGATAGYQLIRQP
jgi:hypothetical protein